MLLSLQMKLIAAAILSAGLLGGVYWVSTLPESYREEGRQEERGKATRVSDAAVIKRDLEFNDISRQLKTERTNRENDKAEHDKKFTQYVADARAGRIPGFNGLRVDRSSICAPRTEETAGTGRNENQTTARLPGAIEEGLFRFANDRDKIIADFEAFKQEVRIAGCFKTE